MSEFWKDEPGIAAELKDVGSLIQDAIDRSHGFIRQLLAAQVKTNGKLLRPALVLIGSRLGDPARRPQVKRIASVLEMIHMASLVHDDVLMMRRPAGACRHLGPGRSKQAVLAGDYLLSRAGSGRGREGDSRPRVSMPQRSARAS